MASSLLKCTICPKKPSFSDISHLLTHVGSKGHLSHLHKLQVRSHQEISAGQELTAYDGWYQQHGLGQLLSERMLHKESRKGNKRGKATTQRHIKHDPEPREPRIRIPAPSNRHPAVRARQLHRTRPARKAKPPSFDLDLDDDSDYDESPTRQRRRTARRVYKSPVKRSPAHRHEPDSEDDCPGVSDPITPKAEDESPRLKGVLWPGMDLFDAATEGMKRRRNQKKDGSALESMERSSELVMPAEAIYSPGGTWQKTRVITGNVDDTSPLRGETPIPKPVRRRRQPLADADGNLPRTSTRRLQDKKRRSGVRGLRERTSKASPYTRSSAMVARHRSVSRFSPTEDENMEFKLTIGNLRDRRKRGNFAVFNDHGYARVQHQSPANVPDLDDFRARPSVSQSHAQQSVKKPQMQFQTTPWLQPQYQQSTSYHNMYATIGQHNLQNTPYDGVGTGKENIEPDFATADRQVVCSASASMGQNPITAQDHFRSIQAPRLGGNFGLAGLNMFDDPFGYSANPLTPAYHQLPSNLESSFLTEDHPFSVAENMKGVISPNGTVSDHGGFDQTQNMFATSE